MGEDEHRPPDGGALFYDRGELIWIPPAGRAPEGSQIIFDANSEAPEAALTPSLAIGAWRAALGHDEVAPRYAFIRFRDGVVSAPIPVSSMARLEHSARLPVSPRTERLLSRIEEFYEVDLETLELFLKLHAMRQESLEKKREVIKRERDPDDDPEFPGPMSAEDFRVIADDDIGGAENLRNGPLADVRRIINATIGLTIGLDDETSEDPLSDLIKKKSSVTEPPPRGGSGQGRSARPSPPVEPGSMEQAAVRVESLLGHVNRTCAALRSPKIDALSPASALGLRLLVMALLKNACPVGEEPSPAHPIPAADRQGGWIRLIGRLLAALQSATEHHKNMASERIEEERLEALALLLFAAGVTLDAARRADTTVASQLQAINASLAKTTASLIVGDPSASAYLERVIAHHDEAYARLSQAQPRERQKA